MKRIGLCIILVSMVLMLTACKSDAVKAVEAQIKEIGTVTEDSSEQLESVKDAYDALPDSDKSSVSNYSTFEKAEQEFDAIRAQEVDDLIAAIGPIDDSSQEKITKARTAYDNLTKDQQQLINNFSTLIHAEKEYDAYIVDRAIDSLTALSDLSASDDDILLLADSIYSSLNEDQKSRVGQSVGDVTSLFNTAKVRLAEKKIDQINYKKGEPSDDELRQLWEVVTYFQSLDISLQKSVKNASTLTTAENGFNHYMENREKTDKLYARSQYISRCEEISYDDLIAYPESYKGHTVSFNVTISKIEKGVLFFPDCLAVVDAMSQKPLELKDTRKVTEPAITEGDSLTVYGKYTGSSTVTVPEDGSGLFGTHLFEKTQNQYTVPTIEILYTSDDNLALIKTGDPNATIVLPSEEIESIKEQLYAITSKQ